jgi:hypothetical protein
VTETKRKTPKSDKGAVSSTEAQRQQRLHQLWLATTDALIAKVRETPASELDAATLQAAVKMLSANGITAESIEPVPGEDSKQARIIRESLAQLPSIDDLDTLSLPKPDFETGGLR